MEDTAVTPHAYAPSRPAVKSSQPQNSAPLKQGLFLNSCAKVQLSREKCKKKLIFFHNIFDIKKKVSPMIHVIGDTKVPSQANN